MKHFSMANILFHEGVNAELMRAHQHTLTKKTEAGFQVFLRERELVVNEVITGTNDSVGGDNGPGTGFASSQEGQIVFHFHTHPPDSRALCSLPDLALTPGVMWSNCYETQVDSNVGKWCNPVFGIACSRSLFLFRVPSEWRTMNSNEAVYDGSCRFIQKEYKSRSRKKNPPAKYYQEGQNSTVSAFWIAMRQQALPGLSYFRSRKYRERWLAALGIEWTCVNFPLSPEKFENVTLAPEFVGLEEN